MYIFMFIFGKSFRFHSKDFTLSPHYRKSPGDLLIILNLRWANVPVFSLNQREDKRPSLKDSVARSL